MNQALLILFTHSILLVNSFTDLDYGDQVIFHMKEDELDAGIGQVIDEGFELMVTSSLDTFDKYPLKFSKKLPSWLKGLYVSFIIMNM